MSYVAADKSFREMLRFIFILPPPPPPPSFQIWKHQSTDGKFCLLLACLHTKLGIPCACTSSHIPDVRRGRNGVSISSALDRLTHCASPWLLRSLCTAGFCQDAQFLVQLLGAALSYQIGQLRWYSQRTSGVYVRPETHVGTDPCLHKKGERRAVTTFLRSRAKQVKPVGRSAV